MADHIHFSKMLYSLQHCIGNILPLHSIQISSQKCLFLAMSCDASVSLLDQILAPQHQTQPTKESCACNPATKNKYNTNFSNSNTGSATVLLLHKSYQVEKYKR